jgi:hypothetical protein
VSNCKLEEATLIQVKNCSVNQYLDLIIQPLSFHYYDGNWQFEVCKLRIAPLWPTRGGAVAGATRAVTPVQQSL